MNEHDKYLKMIGNINVISKEVNDINSSIDRKIIINNLEISFIDNLLKDSTHNFQTIANKLSYNIINES